MQKILKLNTDKYIQIYLINAILFPNDNLTMTNDNNEAEDGLGLEIDEY